MAKHITKSVIEDIAYEIRRVGTITLAYENGTPTEEMIESFGKDDFDISGTATLDWFVANLREIFIQHDPTFDTEKFDKAVQYKFDI